MCIRDSCRTLTKFRARLRKTRAVPRDLELVHKDDAILRGVLASARRRDWHGACSGTPGFVISPVKKANGTGVALRLNPALAPHGGNRYQFFRHLSENRTCRMRVGRK